ncbi:MAG TPA: MerR family transcriptional regulator, partial [Acidimicrobiales bacterium]|nr:MerR family transcriptional regulator [Acidimicrobiales bacterium]
TNEGVNLEGVKKILRLEAELADALARLAKALDQARSSVEEAHRQHRRDLVPVQNTIAEFIEARRRIREMP